MPKKLRKAKVPKKYSGVVVPSKLKPKCFLSTMQRREDLVDDPGGKMPGEEKLKGLKVRSGKKLVYAILLVG